MMRIQRWHDGVVALVVLVCCWGGLAGCASSPDQPAELPSAPPITQVFLSPGDEIEVKFAYAEQFNEMQIIRPDGKIELLFVGEVAAAGKTPAALRQELITEFAKHLKHPQLAVIVRTFNEHRVYVGGMVNEPGVVPMPSRMTALEAIMQAGGFDFERAKTTNVIVIRHDHEGARRGYALDLKPSLEGAVASAFYLQPQDIVFVPRTTITKLNQFMEQYSNKMVPNVGLNFSRTLGRTSFGYDTDARR